MLEVPQRLSLHRGEHGDPQVVDDSLLHPVGQAQHQRPQPAPRGVRRQIGRHEPRQQGRAGRLDDIVDNVLQDPGWNEIHERREGGSAQTCDEHPPIGREEGKDPEEWMHRRISSLALKGLDDRGFFLLPVGRKLFEVRKGR